MLLTAADAANPFSTAASSSNGALRAAKRMRFAENAAREVKGGMELDEPREGGGAIGPDAAVAEAFAAATGDWQCGTCTLINAPTRPTCAVCAAPSPGLEQADREYASLLAQRDGSVF